MKDGGQAFPSFYVYSGPVQDTLVKDSAGMTLRDYFASKAMAAMISSPTGQQMGDAVRDNSDKAAEWAYQYADAMLKARETR